MTTISNNAQNPEMLYTSSPQSSEREFRDGLVGPAEIAQLLKVPISWVYERTRAEESNACPISSSANTFAFLKKKYRTGYTN